MKDWHEYYVEMLKFGLMKEDIKLLNSDDFCLDIGDGAEAQTGVLPEPVSEGEKEMSRKISNGRHAATSRYSGA